MYLIERRRGQILNFSRWPANLDAVDLSRLAQSEMQPALILRAEAAAAGDFLHLPLSVPVKRHLRPDRTSITPRSFQLKLNPLVGPRHRVLVEQQRPILISDH